MYKDNSYWFIICNNQILTNDGAIPIGEKPPITPPDGATIHTFSTLNTLPCRTFEIQKPNEDCNMISSNMINIRASYDTLTRDEYSLAGKASQILHWDRNSRFCPQCGVPTPQIAPIAKKCPICNQEFYPRISTATIVLIKRDDSILLVHARNYQSKVNGLVAGFLEVGETLEECVHREVREETGLTIENIRYFGNQPWPYPSGLMVGFIADYADGEIKLQDEELTAGAFYTRDKLPEIPHKLSIARQMIDAWLDGKV